MSTGPWSPAAVEERVQRGLAQGADVPLPAAPPPTLYLDLAENVVRQATAWQTPKGMIGDPFNEPGVESVTATPRYAAALGHLLAAGRCHDLLSAAERAMDWCCGQVSDHLTSGWSCAVFNMKDLLVLFEALAPFAEVARYAGWRAQLQAPTPETFYAGHRNYLFYGIAAEALRIRLELSDRIDYIDATIESELPWWTEFGMYRDPGDPATYDLTVRQSLAFLLENGYEGQHLEWIRETLRKGALTSLLFTSPCGVAPCGGRSNQYHHMEGMTAYFAEHQAKQAWADGDQALAAAYRRLALGGAEAVKRWILREPYACTKNLMAAEPFLGQDGFGPHQNAHSGYGLLGANLFAGAYHVANQDIPIGSAPYSVGGYMLYLPDAFHRIWATAGDYHLQVDTRGQSHYDPTGLVRFHRRGVPVETSLNMGIVPNPNYNMPMEKAPRAVALGVGWPCDSGWRYLAAANRETHEVTVETIREDEVVEFTVDYHGPEGMEVHEHYALSADGLRLACHVPGADKLRLQVPLIGTDGEERSELDVETGTATARYRGRAFTVTVPGACKAWLEPWPAPNRNGVYRVAVFEVDGDSTVCGLSLD